MTSKKPGLVRYFFFLSIAGNVFTLWSSFSSGIATETSNSFTDEAASFLPPLIDSKLSREAIGANITKDLNTVPFDLKHFLSHIPKTGVEYAANELARLMLATIPLPKEKSIFSVRKSQFRYNQSLQLHPDYDKTNPEWLFFDQNSTKHDHSNPKSDAYSPPIVCNNGKRSLSKLQQFHFMGTKKVKKIKFQCHLVVSEQPFTTQAENVYTIIREPVAHTVSQYFHCVDGRSHLNKHLMPPLSEWLDAYTELADTLPIENRPPYGKNWRDIKKAKVMRREFDCYNPIDSESMFVQFPVKVKNEVGEPLVLPKDYTYPYPYPTEDEAIALRDEKTRQLDQQLFDDLKNRFRIIGDTARMIKSICSIFIDMTDGEYIPTPCDCTHWDETKKQNHSSTPRFQVPNLYQKDLNQGQTSNKWAYRPFLELGYHPDKHSHGVKVHGSDYVKNNLTDFQKTQITDHLRSLDVVLYNISRAVFDVQTAELEKTHGIKICEDSFNREGEVIPPKPNKKRRLIMESSSPDGSNPL